MTADDALGSLGTYRIGAAAAAPPAQRLSRGYAREARCFEEMWRVHLDETAQLREVFSDPGPSLNVEQMVELRMPLQVGFGSPGSPSMGTTAASDDAVMSAAAAMDAVWAADCSIWLDRIRPGDPALLPPSLKEPGALAAFTDPVIATLEFKTRCVPPVTKPMTPPEPQRLAEVDGPTCIDGFYPPGHFRCKADPWLCHQHEYLLDVLQHGENSTVTPPDALVFADGERRAKYRGRLYEWSAERGIYVMTRTEAPVDTHLNREFAVLFSDGYPDQEMFGILWFGASFKADNLEMQLVLPSHMRSIAGGLGKLQTDLARKAGLGWYDVMPFVPRNPWRPQRAGKRDKADGKVRCIINASYPETCTAPFTRRLADDMGGLVFSLNSRSRLSYDEARGSDSARMARFISRLRSTAGSPPPESSGDGGGLVALAESTGTRGKVGNVTIANASSAPLHPHPLYCGRGSMFGNPLCMDREEQRDAACDGFYAILRNAQLSPYAVAANLGLRCDPVQARILHGHRTCMILLLARRVAAGEPLQLVCHCAPLRCHCECIGERISEAAKLLYEYAITIDPGVRGMPILLHLFGGPTGRDDGGLARSLMVRGIHELSVDSLTGLDLRCDQVYSWLQRMARSGAVRFIVAGIPCGTHSRARHRPSTPMPGRYAARPLRDRSRGGAPLPWLTAAEVAFVRTSDLLTRRACDIIMLAWRTGAGYIIENPPDYAVGEWAELWGPIPDHSPLWVAPPIEKLESATAAEKSDCDQCSFGSQFRKPTTLMYSPSTPRLRRVNKRRCACLGPHARQAVGYSDAHGTAAESAAAAAYPLGLHEEMADVAEEHVFGDPRPWPKRARLSVSVSALAIDDDEPKRPPEVKALSSEYMYDDTILKYIARRVGSFVSALDDDFKDWFYQLRLAAASVWMVGLIVLELEKLASDFPELRFLVEKVLGQGTVPGSNLGQRLCELVLHMWDVVYGVLSKPIIAALRVANAALDAYLHERAAAGLSVRLHARGGYTDDVRKRFVFPELTRCGAKAWCFVTRGFRVMMADMVKRQLGTHDVCLGVSYNLSLGVAFITDEKLDKALDALDQLILGLLPVEAYRSLLGLLLHLSFLADMGRSATHGMFTALAALAHGASTLIAGTYLTEVIVARAHEWRARLMADSGAPIAAAVPELSGQRPPSADRTRLWWRSDSCKEGTSHPGIAGVRGADDCWVRPLRGAECELPVAVTEFAGFFGNLYKYGYEALEWIPDVTIMSETDALTPHFVLTRESSQSPLMQHVLRRINEFPRVAELKLCMNLNHLNGEGNVPSDLASRGRFAELSSFYSDMGRSICMSAHPPELDVLLAELVQLHSDTSIGVHNLGMYGPSIAHTRVASNVTSVTVDAGTPAPQGQRRGSVAAVTASIDVTPAPPRRRLAAVTEAAAVAVTPATLLVPLLAFIAPVVPAPPPVHHAAALVHHMGGEAALPPPPPAFGISRRQPASVRQHTPDVSWSPAALAGFAPHQAAADRLLADTSPYALRPTDSDVVRRMCDAVFDDSYDNQGSVKKLTSNMKLWRAYTQTLNTPAWRPDVRDLDAAGRERESILAANFITWAYMRMSGRRGPRPKPSSAYKAYLGVRKSHDKVGITMASTKMVWTMVQRQNRRHLEQFGASSLVVRRKQPFTQAIFGSLLTAADKAGPIDLSCEGPRLAFRAFVAVLRQTGMRKSELALQSHESYGPQHASRSSLTWCLRGTIYSTPPPELLRSPHAGDYAILVPPPSKSDMTGEVWGSLPIYLHYEPSDASCAFLHLANLELFQPVGGRDRGSVPLITPDGRQPFRGAQLDAALLKLLELIVGKSNVSKYSWHSARIHLACSLLASGASSAQIQALCRWQTEDSLRVYARLNPTSYRALLCRASTADVSSVSTSSLPAIDAELLVRQLLGLTVGDAMAITTPAD